MNQTFAVNVFALVKIIMRSSTTLIKCNRKHRNKSEGEVSGGGAATIIIFVYWTF